MAFAPVLITPPSGEVVSINEAKSWLWVDHDQDDVLISSMISAAVENLDGRKGKLGRCLLTQIWRQDFDGWGSEVRLRLPLSDVSAVAVKYYDGDNVLQTVSSSLYQLMEDECGFYVSFLSGFSAPPLYDRADPVQVTMTCGYGAASAVPGPIKTAIMMMVAGWYATRESVSERQMHVVPNGILSMLSPYRSMYV